MTLRVRLALAAGIAVAIAVIAVVVSAYEGTRSDLIGQLDNSITRLAQPVLGRAAGPPGVLNPGLRGPGGGGQPPPGSGQRDPDEGVGLDSQGPQAFGGPSGTFTLIYPGGATYSPPSQQYRIPADQRAKSLARSGSGSYFTDMTVSNTHIRVLVTGIGPKGALMVALPMTDVDRTLHNQLLLLIGIGAGGIALAAFLGILVARTALQPIARFTRRTEAIAAAPERLDQRVEATGRDELSRLGRTFNATLDALERSVQAQRNLVADASHELRTPIATLRANLQLLRDEDRLSHADRGALREDMIRELDELTGLVGDVVELARGSKPSGVQGDVRVDEIVESEVERTRRRAPELTVTASLEPTLVHGEGDRIARVVANLLDNARKWSPAGAAIDVELHAGTLTVRDHGPGFREHDLPFVFDRFHRSPDARTKPGSGLGLAIVRQAAEAHGGFAEAANAPDRGAILRVGFGPTLALDVDQLAAAREEASSGASDGVHPQAAPPSRGRSSRSSIVKSSE
jgi:two-component system, OmpR family, sensor histidine kinase MprB